MKSRYESALRFSEFLEHARKNAELWRDTYRLVKVPAESVDRVSALAGRWHLLVMVEDWCGDAVNTVPMLARLAELAPNLDLRIIGRDDNPDIMDAHLTNGSRSIPIVIVLDADYVERGWWGPRPAELQQWVVGEGKSLEKDERYRRVRTWYARDRGRTTAEELIDVIARATRQTSAAA